MRIVVLQGSPHKKGSSNMLAHEFISGASSVGHSVTVLDGAQLKLNYCAGCDECKKGGDCVQQDDGAVVREEMLSADMVVFVTPVYYFGMSAQLKTIVDRFHGYTQELKNKKMKAVLIASLADTDDKAILPLKAHYERICEYLRFENAGEIFGKGCANPTLTLGSKYMKEAFDLGRNI